MTDWEDKRNSARFNFWIWLGAATLTLTLSAIAFEMGMRCISSVPMFLFLVSLLMVAGSMYSYGTIDEKEALENARIKNISNE